MKKVKEPEQHCSASCCVLSVGGNGGEKVVRKKEESIKEKYRKLMGVR